MMRRLPLLTLYLIFCPPPAFTQGFYDVGTIQKIEVSFSQSNWDYILDTAKQGSDTYTLSQWVKINGVQFDSAGVKYKGNSSYNSSNAKNPLHIELDHFREQDYQGYKDIKLSNGFNEPSFVREVLLYAMFQPYTKLPVANFAQVYINGQYIGLYTNVEAVTKTFLESRFFTNDYTFVFADLGGCDLRYRGSDTTLYYSPYTMKSDYGWTDLMNLCYTLRYDIGNIENVLDVDRALWVMAATNATLTLDSYLGNSKHNYYLYKDHNGRFHHIIWDLNGGLGVFNRPEQGPPYSISQLQTLSPMLHSTDTLWPLVKGLLDVPMYRRMYIAHMKTIVNENFTDSAYFETAQYLQSIADTAVQSDVNKFGTYTQFLDNLTTNVVIGTKTIPGISLIMEPRIAYLNATPEFQQAAPVISVIAASDSDPELNAPVYITAHVGNAVSVFIGWRNSVLDRFIRVPMYDDGAHGDGTAGDNVYGASVSITGQEIQYFIYAENGNAGMFSPERAENEYYTLRAGAEKDAGISVYPNPSSGYFTVSSDELISLVQVFNVLGEKILEGAPWSDEVDVHLPAYPPGIYFVRVEDAMRKKVVKVVVGR
jgi:hypothetical protein